MACSAPEVRYLGPDLDDKEVEEALVETSGIRNKASRSVSSFLLLVPVEASLELRDVPVPVANSFQRLLGCELPGCRLVLPDHGYSLNSTDPFMSCQYLQLRLRTVPLNLHISSTAVENVRFGLKYENRSERAVEVRLGDLSVTRGSLTAPIFNPHLILGTVQPGKTLYLEDIRIVRERHAAAPVAVRTRQTPLDVPEIPMPAAPDSEASLEEYLGRLKVATRSGYAKSSLVHQSFAHRVTVVYPAVALQGKKPSAADSTYWLPFADCAKYMAQRLQRLAGPLGGVKDGSYQDPQILITTRTASSGTVGAADGQRSVLEMQLTDETETLGQVLVAYTLLEYPETLNVTSSRISHETFLRYTLVDRLPPEDLPARVLRVIERALDVYRTLQTQITALHRSK